MKQRNFAPAVWRCSYFLRGITCSHRWFFFAVTHGNLENALMQMYLFLMNFTGPLSNQYLHPGSKQLVTAFLQDAILKKTTRCRQALGHYSCLKTSRATRFFAIMSLPSTTRTWAWSSITARFSTTTRVPTRKLEEQGRIKFNFGCVWV